MSENQDTSKGEEARADALKVALLAAVARIGIEHVDGSGGSPEELITELNAAGDRFDALKAENERLVAENKKLEAAAKKAASTAKAEKRAAPKLRKIGQLKDGEARLSASDLHELIRDADEVEVVFSDGKSEIAGLDAIVVSGDAWRHGPFGLKLDLPDLTVTGPARDAYEVDGYGLLIDGVLVAYHKRMDPLRIGPNARVSLKDDVIFGG